MTVRKHVGHEESAVVLGGQLDADVLEIRGRIGAHVDDDIPDRAPHAADELWFGRGWDLIVHPPQSSSKPAEGDIGLYHL
jgi:hypothetical protein